MRTFSLRLLCTDALRSNGSRRIGNSAPDSIAIAQLGQASNMHLATVVLTSPWTAFELTLPS